MASDTLHKDQLKAFFEKRDSFDADDITVFYQQFDPEVTETTINWRIHALLQQDIIQRIGHGLFKLGKENKYVPHISPEIKSIYHKVEQRFPYVDLCVWSTSVFNEFMIHQAIRFLYLVEVEQVATESVFHYLQEEQPAVFLEPSQEVVRNYLPSSDDACIVQSLVSEAPVMDVDDITHATLEKMLVDIFCDSVTFTAYQGSQRSTIFKEAFDKYTVNRSKLLRYANRRGKKEDLTQYLKSLQLPAVNNY